jgi:GTP-binding protein
VKRSSRVAIVGRPNVGKSTLFNRISGTRRAIVHPAPGITRDVQRLTTEWGGVPFELIDTGGLFSGLDDNLIHQVESRAIEEAMGADIMVLVTDGEDGVTPGDIDVANRMRQAGVPVFVAVNKCEKAARRDGAGEFFRLGFEHVYPISALHGEGIGDLLDAVINQIPRRGSSATAQGLKLAIVGRPNVGKSSLVNALVGSEAAIVDSRPGTTRDSVDVQIRWYTHDVTLVDTAGINRQARSRDGLTSIVALKSIDTIERADVVAIVLDASREIAAQDVKVASYAHKAGKGILFCVNKWDLVEEKGNRTAPEFEKRIHETFAFASYAPVIFVSALTHQRVNKILEQAWEIDQTRRTRVGTGELNRVIEEVKKMRPASFYGGGTGKIYYATQVGDAPPTFLLFVNKRAFFSRSYLRYVNNQLRRRYPFIGSVIRIKLSEKEKRA